MFKRLHGVFRRPGRWFFCFVAFFALFWAAGISRAGCGSAPALEPATAGLPAFQDDLPLSSLFSAIKQSFRYLDQLPAAKKFTLCGKPYSVADLKNSLLEFVDLLGRVKDKAELDRLLKERFEICPANGGQAGGILLTGYFEPLVRGSLVKDDVYRYPLYKTPPDLAVRGNGQRLGRAANGAFVPYWTRAEIEERNLLAGRELVFLADPVDAFILHVQGSGKVRLPDGSVRRVQYAAKNGRPYRSIGRLLADEGKIPLEEVDLPRIIRYLKEHPEERRRILYHNESYVFFRWGDNSAAGPLGCFGVPLTAGRSIALDQDCFPPGVLGFLRSRKPRLDKNGDIVGWETMSRFVLNQDSGSAIKGPGRADLFWGSGPYAEKAAGAAKYSAQLYLLVKKK